MNESSQISISPAHHIWPIALRLLVGAALLAFVFSHEADLKHVAETLRGADVPRLLLALLIAVSGELVTAWKWSLLVRFIGGRLPFLTAVRASFIGMFYNNFLPGSVGGDVVRVLLIARQAGGKARATASAFMQRNTGLAGLFAIGIPAAVTWPRALEWSGGGTAPAWLRDCLPWLLLAAAGYCAVNVILFSRRAYDATWHLLHHLLPRPGSHQNIAGRTVAKFFEKLRRFHTELHGYRFWLPGALVLSAASQMIDIFMVWNLAQALHIAVPFTVLLVAVPFVTLANLLPITINGIGLRETVYVAILASAAIPASQAVALSLMQFAVVLTLSTAGGVLQWWQPGKPTA